MKRHITVLSLLLLWCLFSLASVAEADKNSYRDWIVRFDVVELPENLDGSIRDVLAQVGRTVDIKAVHLPGTRRLVMDVDVALPELQRLLERLLPVRYLEPNRIWRPASVIPNDPGFGQQWGLRNIGQTIVSPQDPADGYSAACDSKPGDSFDICDKDPVAAGNAGKNIDIDADLAWAHTPGSSSLRIAIVDTGIDPDHPDFLNRTWKNTDGSLDGTEFAAADYGWDACKGNGTPEDEIGHGTQVAGVAAANVSDGVGIAGVAWQAEILPVRFLGPIELEESDCNTTAAALEALDFVLKVGADVVNMSWGGPEPSQALEDKLKELAAADMVLVAAAGNEGVNFADQPFYPAAYDMPQLLSVAAHTNDGNLSAFSNLGGSVNIAAPGSSIRSDQVPFSDIWDFANFGGYSGESDELAVGAIPGTNFSVEAEDSSYWGVGVGLLGDVILAGDLDTAKEGEAHRAGIDQAIISDSVDLQAWGSAVFRYDVFHDLGEDSVFQLWYRTDANSFQALPSVQGEIPGKHTGQGGGEFSYDFSALFTDELPDDFSIQFTLKTASAHAGGEAGLIQGGVQLLNVGWYKPDKGPDAYADDRHLVYTQGTSLAAPFVSGVAILVRSLFPAWTASDIVQQILQRAAILPVADSGVQGDRMLNALNALSADPLLVWLGEGAFVRDGVDPDQPESGRPVTFAARLLDPELQLNNPPVTVNLVDPEGTHRWLPATLDDMNTIAVTDVVYLTGIYNYRFVVTGPAGEVPGEPAAFQTFEVVAGPDGAVLPPGTQEQPEAGGCGCSTSGSPPLDVGVLLAEFALVMLVAWKWRRRHVVCYREIL